LIPAGYLLKRLALRPEWIKNPTVKDIYSVSGHGSADFADYINYWKHNGWWFFNRPDDMIEIMEREGMERSALTLFYYEVFEQQYNEREKQWTATVLEKSFTTDVEQPAGATLEGYDVVSFFAGSSPECSPLFCNSLAEALPVNEHCLFDDFDFAKEALDAGKFANCEPGPYRIFAVYKAPSRSAGER
jgi:hypothetical protein